MAHVSQSYLKHLLNHQVFSFGKCFLYSHNPSARVNLQSRRQIVTSAAWRSKQVKGAVDRQSKQRSGNSDKPSDKRVPLIVQLMKKNRERLIQKEKDTSRLTVQQLQKSLEDIQWDADASIRRASIEDLKDSDEETDLKDPDHEGEMHDFTTIEDIYLDDEVPTSQPHKHRTEHKQKIKGTPNPSIPASDTPCSGCGATLHCQDPLLPGYMPSEKFTCLTREALRTSMCQRCFLINAYNMFLNVRVTPDTYPEILQEIKHTKSLVIVVVDLFDMKNSVYADLLKHIGTNRSLFIVGNKVDLIAGDSKGYLERVKQALVDTCNAMGLNPTGRNMKHVCLVSAKTGYGIEDLVTKLMMVWQLKGHVYVVGSTNAGKSTLFNALLMSDYCKSVARGFINRATVSVWPGTTLNLLKFPITNPAPWRLALRSKRLVADAREYEAAEELRRSRLHDMGSYKANLLTGHIGLTDFRSLRTISEERAEVERQSEGQDVGGFRLGRDGSIMEEARDAMQDTGSRRRGYKPDAFHMYWCNDTPGVLNTQQIINLLEPEELVTVLPRHHVRPQCVVIKPGHTLFLTGMGRLDYVHGKKSIFLTAHVSHTVKLHVKDSKEADDFYLTHLGSHTLGVPLGDEERLSRIPSLVGREFHVTGTDWDEAAADIQLSSLGWVSVAAGRDMPVTLRAYTPGGRGLHLRTPALLPNYKRFRGKRKGKSPFYLPVLSNV